MSSDLRSSRGLVAGSAITPIRTDSKLHIVSDIFRICFSFACLIFSLIAVAYAIYAGDTTMPDTFSNYSVFILFTIAILILAIVEGLHVAAVQVAYENPDTYRIKYCRGAQVVEYQNKGRHFQQMLVGRQIVVVLCVFTLGRITVIDTFLSESIPGWIVSSILYTGLLGVLITVVIAQLTPQILSSAYPIQFLNMPGMQYVYYLLVFLENTGIAHAVWFFAWILKHMLKYCMCHSLDRNRFDIECNGKSNGYSNIDQQVQFLDILENCSLSVLKNIKRNMNALIEDLQMKDGYRIRSNGVIVVSDEDEDNDDISELEEVEENHLSCGFEYPSVGECAQQFRDRGLEPPAFLLSGGDNYVPAHIIALQLLKKQEEEEEKVEV